MRKIVVGMFVSLDGVMEGPGPGDDFPLAGWTMPYWDEDVAQYVDASMAASDTLLLGRITYQAFAVAFGDAPAHNPDAATMNSFTKYVVSTTLEQADWANSTLIRQNVVEEIARLKDQPGRDIAISGSGQVVHTLMRANLIDEYRLLIYPVILGQGKRLFPPDVPVTLELVDARTSAKGVLLVTYRPAQGPAATPGAHGG
ncbi:MAG TPA: dihydrofolate reductase family protein [Chloroflexia bacterium]|nr:dihydrofolate reductase family protein [Chloroflexia bacterium]